MARYLLIPAIDFDAETGILALESPRIIEGPDSLRLLQDAVGGLIEFPPLQDRASFEIVANEEGQWVHADSPNLVATALWQLDPLGFACLVEHPVGCLLGPCVVVGPNVRGETTDVSDETVAHVMGFARLVVDHLLDEAAPDAAAMWREAVTV